MNKNAYLEAERWEQELIATASPAADGPEGHKKVLPYIIEQLFREIELEIYQRGKDGELKFDSKGRPKINWINVITGIGKLVGKIIFLRRAFVTLSED